MRRPAFHWLLACLFVAVASPAVNAAPATAADLDRLAWMTGAWASDTAGVRTEEHWMAPAAGLMVGMNRTVRRGRASFELLRIIADTAGVAYLGSPGGRPATRFALAEAGQQRVVFANPNHDFPQRILYWLDSHGHLHARVEGTVNGRTSSMEWRWKPLRPEGR